jgi:hypothetical protein
MFDSITQVIGKAEAWPTTTPVTTYVHGDEETVIHVPINPLVKRYDEIDNLTWDIAYCGAPDLTPEEKRDYRNTADAIHTINNGHHGQQYA